MLVKFINDKKDTWEDYLDTCIFAYNTSKQESIKYSPFELMFARKPVLPIDLQSGTASIHSEVGGVSQGKFLDICYHAFTIYKLNYTDQIYSHFAKTTEVLNHAKTNILNAQLKQKEVYNRKHSNPEVYQVGGYVLKKDFLRKKRKGGKLDHKWVGPYIIVANLGRGLYRLQDVNDSTKFISRVNGVHLKKYIIPNEVTYNNLLSYGLSITFMVFLFAVIF